MASWACCATARCEAVGLGLWVCGCVWLRVFAGSRHTEPQSFSLSKVTGTCVPAWPSLGSCSPHPGDLSGSQTTAVASRRQERSLPCSPPPSPASGAGGISLTCPCSLDTPSRSFRLGGGKFNFAHGGVHVGNSLIKKCVAASSFVKDVMSWDPSD